MVSSVRREQLCVALFALCGGTAALAPTPSLRSAALRQHCAHRGVDSRSAHGVDSSSAHGLCTVGLLRHAAVTMQQAKNKHRQGSRATNNRARRSKLFRDMETPIDPRQPDGAAEDDPAAPLALAAVRAVDARKAKDVIALRVSHLTSATSFFVNMAASSRAQIDAIVKNVEDELSENFGRKGSRQGKSGSGWVCLDYDEIVVNVFSEQEREFYQVEKFWAAGQSLDLSDVLIPNLAPSPSAGGASDGDDGWVLDGGDDDDWGLGDADDDDWVLTKEEWGVSNARPPYPPPVTAPRNRPP